VHTPAASDDAPKHNSGFGLSKLAIATTRSGKLCAISTLTGDIVWSKLLPQNSGKHTVYVTRPRSVLGYSPEFALLTTTTSSSSSSSNGESAVVGWYDALTGERSSDVQEVVVRGEISSVVPLDLHDAEGRQILMIVNK
jgi:hypothetical protein